MHFEISSFVQPGNPGGNRLHQTKTPRDQYLVARGLKQVRPLSKLFRLQLQRRRIDAVAQAGRAWTVGEDMAEMAVAFRAHTSVRTMPWLTSRSSSTWLSTAGAVKLGQPQPESNLASDSTRLAAARRRYRCRCGARAHILRRTAARSPFRAAPRIAVAIVPCATRPRLDELGGCFGIGHLASFS